MAYLGLVPREHSSGERTRRGSITKAGNSRCRHILAVARELVGFMWAVMRELEIEQGAAIEAAA